MDGPLIKEFRDEFKKQHVDPPSSHFANFDPRDVARVSKDDVYARSFITWKKGNVEQAVKLAVDVLEWRKKNKVTDLSIEDIGEDFYKNGSMFIRGRDKKGNRILTFLGKRFHKDQEASAKKMFIYLMEQMNRQEPGSRVTFILDAGDCGMNNVDLGFIRLIVDSFMYYFPSFLERTFIVDLPGILTAIWNIVKVWFDEEIKNRTSHCSRKDLAQHISADQLLTVLGGEDSWSPSCLEQDLLSEFKRGDDAFVDALENFHLDEA